MAGVAGADGADGVGGGAWLRAAAVTASLAGLRPEEAVSGFGAADGASLVAAMRALVVSGDRVATARAIARARALLGSTEGSGPAGGAGAASGAAPALAALVRGLEPGERAALVRFLDPSLLRAAAQHRDATAPGSTRDAAALVALAAAELPGGVGAAELAALVHAAAWGDGPGAPAFVSRALRSARVAGLDACAAARSLWPAFARREGAGQE